MKCPFSHGADSAFKTNSAYQNFLRLEELFSRQGSPSEWVHPDQQLVIFTLQSKGLWLLQLESDAANEDRCAVYRGIIDEHDRLFRCVAPDDFSLIREELDEEHLLGSLLSLLPTERTECRDRQLFLFSHWTNEMFAVQTALDLDRTAYLVLAEDFQSANTLLQRIPLFLILCQSTMNTLGEFFSIEDFNILAETSLQEGTGKDSPGHNSILKSARTLAAAYTDRQPVYGTPTITEILKPQPEAEDNPLWTVFGLMKSVSEWYGKWKLDHYRLALKYHGEGGSSLQGRPIQQLEKWANTPLFPDAQIIVEILDELVLRKKLLNDSAA